MTSDTLQLMVDKIIDLFDFERVHKVMEFVDWKYIEPNGSLQVPSIERLKAAARRCLLASYRCYKKFGDIDGTACSGGFHATYLPGNQESGAELILRFVLQEEDIYEDDLK